MLECQLVYHFEGRATKDRDLAARLQRTTSAQLVELLATGRICADMGDPSVKKTSTGMLEQGIQTEGVTKLAVMWL
jgi:hypothetical protein